MGSKKIDPPDRIKADDRTEFDRFADLTRKLIKVPKKELDEAREQEKAEKD